ncbi:MAG: hypothetical protein GXP45_01165 [bacterium]|nr:hypothetical protein [bacterium]
MSGNALDPVYSWDFTTQKNVFLTYAPTLFEESIQNDGSIKNEMTITLTGDIFSTDVITNNHIVATNIPS